MQRNTILTTRHPQIPTTELQTTPSSISYNQALIVGTLFQVPIQMFAKRRNCLDSF